MLKLADYAKLVNLHVPFIPYRAKFPNDTIKFEETNELIQEIAKECKTKINYVATNENKDQTMTLIRSYLNQRGPYPLSERFLTLLDHYFADFRADDPITNVGSISTIKNDFPHAALQCSDKMSLWMGDITLLECDAIVNAANEQMLGCFAPMHKCIDNCIHTFASPRLRDDMAKIMEKQKHLEETGIAKITRAYNLPSKFVLHTVGPIYSEHPTEESEQLLESCYLQCLKTASQVKEVKSIAFCCISTGIFGFPKDKAARIALATTDKWLSEHPNRFDRIIFNVFGKQDYDIYARILSE